MNIFEFKSYKAYLTQNLGSIGRRKGLKSALAKAINCQPTYISQILNGNAHMSLEQAEATNGFLNHSKVESHFFMLLVQHEKAGTKQLKDYFFGQIQSCLNDRMVLTKRVGKAKTLSKLDQAEYYSSWTYAAIHVAITIPHLNNPIQLSNFFKLNINIVNKVLNFLKNKDLIKQNKNGKYEAGEVSIRLGNDSHNILKHHTNWRIKTIDSLENETINDLHYSGVVSLSKKDAYKIKDNLLKLIKDNLRVIKDSSEEKLFCLSLDFFDLKQ